MLSAPDSALCGDPHPARTRCRHSPLFEARAGCRSERDGLASLRRFSDAVQAYVAS